MFLRLSQYRLIVLGYVSHEVYEVYLSFSGAFAKLLKATISIAMSVCPSVRMAQLGSHWTDFDEIRYFSCLRKSVEKIQSFIKIRQE